MLGFVSGTKKTNNHIKWTLHQLQITSQLKSYLLHYVRIVNLYHNHGAYEKLIVMGSHVSGILNVYNA